MRGQENAPEAALHALEHRLELPSHRTGPHRNLDAVERDRLYLDGDPCVIGTAGLGFNRPGASGVRQVLHSHLLQAGLHIAEHETSVPTRENGLSAADQRDQGSLDGIVRARDDHAPPQVCDAFIAERRLRRYAHRLHLDRHADPGQRDWTHFDDLRGRAVPGAFCDDDILLRPPRLESETPEKVCGDRVDWLEGDAQQPDHDPLQWGATLRTEDEPSHVLRMRERRGEQRAPDHQKRDG